MKSIIFLFTGEEITAYIPTVAKLYIEIFRDFPYLCAENEESAKKMVFWLKELN